TIRATVDLPEPDSPTNAVVVPRCRAKFTSSAATNSVLENPLPGNLNTLVRPSICMTASDACWPAVFSTCCCVAWRISIRSRAEARSDCKDGRSEEHTSELQSRFDLVCRLLLEKKNTLCMTTLHFYYN